LSGKAGLKVQPNPFSTELNLVIQDIEWYDLYVVDQLGRMIFKSENIRDTQLSINTNDWPSGVLMLMVHDKLSDQYFSKKIVRVE